MPEKNFIVFILIVIPLALVAAVFYTGGADFIPIPQGKALPVLKVGGVSVRTEIAETPEERRRGLGGRDALLENHGMLFVFDTPAPYGIWMEDMRFAIDILWLNAEGKIVDLKQNVVPETYPEVFYPKEDALYVLELPARFTELRSVSRGDFVTLPENIKK